MGTKVSVLKDINGRQEPALIDLDEYVADAVKALVPRGTKATPKEEKIGTPLGTGLSYYVDGDRLVLTADLSTEAWKKAKPSKNKQNLLVASSRGTPLLSGSPIPGLRIAFNLFTDKEPT